MPIEYQKDGRIAIFTINRPEVMNALSPEALSEMTEALIDFRDNKELWVGIITGAGEKAFCTGLDLRGASPGSNLNPGRQGAPQATLVRGLELWKPLIAAVNGYALGGGLELALACDFIYASENAKFGQPEINLGIIPGFGGTQRLSRLLGKAIAKELCMTGLMISAQEAKALGLVNKVFPPDKLWEETMKTANLIASKGKVSLRSVKQCIDRGYDTDLRRGCQMECDHFGLCMSSPDAKEGMSAFLEKRKPEFKGELD